MGNWHTMHTEGHQKQIAGYALGNEVKHHNSFIVTHAHTKICFYILWYRKILFLTRANATHFSKRGCKIFWRDSAENLSPHLLR
jgi:hypothetical protein